MALSLTKLHFHLDSTLQPKRGCVEVTNVCAIYSNLEYSSRQYGKSTLRLLTALNLHIARDDAKLISEI